MFLFISYRMNVVKLVFSEEKATKGLNLVSSKRKAEHVELTNAIVDIDQLMSVRDHWKNEWKK